MADAAGAHFVLDVVMGRESLEPLTIACLQAQLQRPARRELGDFEHANVENWTA
jgi:hypothetical protein